MLLDVYIEVEPLYLKNETKFLHIGDEHDLRAVRVLLHLYE